MFLSASIQPNRSLQMQWSAVPGRLYQLQTSTDLRTWLPLTEWLQAQGNLMSYTTTNRSDGTLLFRLQVRP
jgi:hypothetical protein